MNAKHFEESRAALERTSASFHELMEQRVRPALNLHRLDEEELGLAGVGKRIADEHLRREYVRRAIDMLDAKIALHSRAVAPNAGPNATASISVVAALLCAAFGYYLNGAVAALLAAAFGYWLGAWYSSAAIERAAREAALEAKRHNDAVADWQQTVDGWRKARAELLSI